MYVIQEERLISEYVIQDERGYNIGRFPTKAKVDLALEKINADWRLVYAISFFKEFSHINLIIYEGYIATVRQETYYAEYNRQPSDINKPPGHKAASAMYRAAAIEMKDQYFETYSEALDFTIKQLEEIKRRAEK